MARKVPLTVDYIPRMVHRMTGKELRAIRKRMGLTQVEFAALVGVAPNSIARQERGEIGIREPLGRLVRLLANQKTSESEGKRRGKKA
jgi:transcriptional regulator with XRE-family HTH domain